MNKQYTWELKEDTEFWRNDKFDTVEKCVADYKGNYADENAQESIFVGEVEPFEIAVNGRQVIESIEENSYEECGECAENWEPSIGKTMADWGELDEQLTKVVIEWLKKYNDMPYFYNVVDIREVKVDKFDLNERKYVAVSIKFSMYDKSPEPILWGYERTADSEERCFYGYTYDVNICELYSLNDFLKRDSNWFIKCDEPVKMCIDYKKKYKDYDIVLVDIEEVLQYLNCARSSENERD